MNKEEHSMKSPASMKLGSLIDLVKLLISTARPGERSGGYLGYYGDDDRSIYFLINTTLGYYELNALPFVVWVEETERPTNAFLRYQTSPSEKLEFSEDATDPKWFTLPIIKFEEMPKYLRVWEQ